MIPIKDMRIKQLKESPKNPLIPDYLTMRKGGITLDQPPGNPYETLTPYERQMFAYKKGGKIKDKKKSKKGKGKPAMSQIQKVNIKIGDLSKLLEKDKTKNGDTALLMKDNKVSPYPIQTSTSTYLRLESPAFKYMAPLPHAIPNLYQANPSSISQPLVSGKEVSSKGGDLQPEIKNPVVVDTDPNDLQQTSIKSHSTRVIPSFNLSSGSISGSVNDPSLSSKEALYVPEEEEYDEYYSPQQYGLMTNAPNEEPIIRSRYIRAIDGRGRPTTKTKEIEAQIFPSDIYNIEPEEKGPLQFSMPRLGFFDKDEFRMKGRETASSALEDITTPFFRGIEQVPIDENRSSKASSSFSFF